MKAVAISRYNQNFLELGDNNIEPRKIGKSEVFHLLARDPFLSHA